MREGDGPGRKLRRPRAQNAERSQATRTRGTGASRRRGASRRPNTVAEQAGAEELPPWPGGAFTLRATGIPGPAPPGQTRLREAVQPLPPSLRPPLSFIAVESLKKKNLAPQTPFQHAATHRFRSGGWALICEGSRDVWASSEPGVHSHLIRQTTKCTLMLKNGNET